MTVGLPLQLWRYANGIPLLDYKDDVLTCALFETIRTAKWKKFGHVLRVKTCTLRIEDDRDCLFGTPSLILVPKRIDPETFMYAPEFDATDTSVYKSSHKYPPMQAANTTSATNDASALRDEKDGDFDDGDNDSNVQHLLLASHGHSSVNFNHSHAIRFQNRESNLFHTHYNVPTRNKRMLDGFQKQVSRSQHQLVQKNSFGQVSGDILDQGGREEARKISRARYDKNEAYPVDSTDQKKEDICQCINKYNSKKVQPSQMIILLDVRAVAGNYNFLFANQCITQWKLQLMEELNY